MKHQNPDELVQKAEILTSVDGLAKMSRRERLERWASALERHGGPLNALRQIEYLSPEELRAYRAPGTPLTVAFADPVLRDEGLAGDRLGEAMDFFAMTEKDAHELLCDCHYYGAMTGAGLGRQVRRYARRGAFYAACKRAVYSLLGRSA
jgi:hypothetical protein